MWVFFILLPVRYEGGWIIPMGVLSDLLTKTVGEYMPLAVLAIVVVSALLCVWYSLINPPAQDGYSGLRRIFFVGRGWLALRLAESPRDVDIALIGGDVVEVSPPYDQTGNTALVGATLMFEILCLLADRAGREQVCS